MQIFLDNYETRIQGGNLTVKKLAAGTFGISVAKFSEMDGTRLPEEEVGTFTLKNIEDSIAGFEKQQVKIASDLDNARAFLAYIQTL